MADAQLSPDLIRFIQATLPSYDAAVLLVVISREPERVWTVDDILPAMGAGPDSASSVRQHIEHFARVGVLESAGEGAFRLAEGQRTVVEELRLAYDRRPVTLIRAIDSAARRIQSFADSFKLKRDRE